MAEDLEANVEHVQQSEALREGARALAARAVGHAELLLATGSVAEKTSRGGRKACRLGP